MSSCTDESSVSVRLVGNARRLYLDTSFFVELRRNFSLRSKVARQLADLTEELPLCLSFISVVELAQGMSTPSLREMARFIDSLKPCWLRSECELERQEILSYLGSPEFGPFGAANPFDRCIYGIFKEHLRWNEVHHLISDTMDLETALCRFQESQRGRSLLNAFSHNRGYCLGALREDRRVMAGSAEGDDKRSMLEAKARRYVQARVKQVFTEQVIEGNPGLSLPRAGALFIPDASLLSSIEEGDVVKFPLFFLSREFLLGRAAGYRDMSDTNFLKRGPGEVGDFFHTFGAAYCDFFSCDLRTSAVISKARACYGLRAPFVMDETGPSGLLTKIESSL